MFVPFLAWFVINVAIIAVAHFVPSSVGKKFGPEKGLVVGSFFLAALLGYALSSGSFGMFDALALAALVRGAVVNYRACDEAQIVARGEAAIAAAETRS